MAAVIVDEGIGARERAEVRMAVRAVIVVVVEEERRAWEEAVVLMGVMAFVKEDFRNEGLLMLLEMVCGIGNA